MNLKSRKLIVAVSTIISIFTLDILGVDIGIETIIGVVTIVFGYLGGQGLADQGKEAEKIKLQK